MVWVAVGGLAVCVTLALWAAARRKGGAVGTDDLGSISSSWLNERRAHDRESDPNR
jgi:hypothetical protein